VGATTIALLQRSGVAATNFAGYSSFVIRRAARSPRAIAGRQTENKKETRDASLFCDIDWQQLMAIRF